MAITVLFNISVVFHLDNRTKALIHTCAPREARATFWVGARIHVVMNDIEIPDEVPVSATGIWKRGGRKMFAERRERSGGSGMLWCGR